MTMENINISESDLMDPVYFQVGYLKQTPHAKQIEVLRSPHKNKIIVCGRRSGKSQIIAAELIRGAIMRVYKRQMVIAPVYKQTLIVYHKIIELMTKARVMHDIESYKLNPPKITFKNGSIIEFGSADNPDSLRGEAYERIFLDESAFIKAGAMNAIKPLIYDFGAPVWETTTPWGKGEVWERWKRGKKGDPDYGCFHYNYLDNPYLDAEGVKEIEKDIEEYGKDSIFVQCEIYGNFEEDRDVFFPRELIESCIDNTYKYPIEPNRRYTYYLGVDFARMGQDNTVFVSLLQEGGVIQIANIVETSHKLLTDSIGRVVNMNNEYQFVKIMTDETGLGSGPTDILAERFGYKVEGVTFTTKSKQDMYSNLKKLMQQGKIKFPNHKKLIFQLMDLRYETMSSGQLKIHHSDRGNDDYPDALALACWACKETEVYKPTLA